MNQIGDPTASSFSGKGFFKAKFLGFRGDEERRWKGYTTSLQRSHMRLQNVEETLVRETSPSQKYSPKEGYGSSFKGREMEDLIWWWREVWGF